MIIAKFLITESSGKKSNITNIINDYGIFGYIYRRRFYKEKYEELRKEVGWEQNHPTGILIHASGLDSSGNIRVADIWETEQDFTNYLNSKLKPAMEKINLPVPKGELIPIHNVNAFQGIESYRL